VSQVVDLLGAHGLTSLGIAAHGSAISVGGVLVGFLQQRNLNLSSSDKKRWLLLSPVAYATSFIAGEILGGLYFGLALSLILFGLMSGFWQSIVFTNYTDRAAWWIGISTFGFTAAGIIASALLFASYRLWAPALLESPVILSQAVIGAICGAVAGSITGYGYRFLFSQQV